MVLRRVKASLRSQAAVFAHACNERMADGKQPEHFELRTPVKQPFDYEFQQTQAMATGKTEKRGTIDVTGWFARGGAKIIAINFAHCASRGICLRVELYSQTGCLSRVIFEKFI